MAATDLESATASLISSVDIISDVLNEDATKEVVTPSGSIPSLRKALADNVYFQDPVPWSNGDNETNFNQLRTFTDGSVWWSPSATNINPVPMGVTPVGDSNWYPWQDRNLKNNILEEVTRFKIKGTFAAGFTYETADDVGLDNSGNPWSYTGSLPFTVPAGTVPSNPDYQEEDFSGVDSVSGLRDELNDRAVYLTLAQAQASDLEVDQSVIMTDLDNTLYKVVVDTDTGGYYLNYKTGFKFKLSQRKVSATGLNMVSGVGQDNSSILSQLDNFDWDELEVDDHYEYTSDVPLIMTGRTVKIHGSGELHGVNAYISMSGSLTDLGQITASDQKFGRSITIPNATNVNKNDILIIHNQNDFSFSSHRAEYQDGEFNIVKSKASNQLFFESALKGDYTSLTNIKCFKLNHFTVSTENVKFTSEGTPLYSLAINYGSYIDLDNTFVRGVDTTQSVGALLLNKTFGFTINRGGYYCDTPATGHPFAGLQYGVNVSSCANGRVYDCTELHAARHGVTTGGDGQDGAVPCDDIKVYRSKISNDGTVYSADFHGNSRNCGYYNCEIDNDVGLGGEDIDCIGNVIVANRANPPIELQEIVGGQINIKDNQVKLGSNFNFNTLIAFSSSALSQKVDREFELNLEGNSYEVNSGVTQILTMLYNQNNTVKSTLDMRNFNVSGDTSGLVRYASLSRLGSGLNPDQVTITDDKFLLSSVSEFVNLSGVFSGTKFTLPSQRMPDTPLTIAAGGSESSSGGSGNTGLYNWDFVGYPTDPHLSIDHNGWARAGDPQFFGAIDSLTNSSANLFLTTAANSITTPVERTITINAQAVFDGVLL